MAPPTANASTSSTAPSNTTLTLRSTPLAESHNTEAPASSVPSESVSSSSEEDEEEDEEDDSSEADSDSDEEDGEDEEDEERDEEATRVPTKPNMRVNEAGDLKSRLAAFLPQLAESNLQIEQLKKRGEYKGMEDVEEGSQYIEMDLGLGVLEEKKPGQEEEEEDEDEKMEEAGGAGDKKEEDVLGKLMGYKKGRPNVGISEVDES